MILPIPNEYNRNLKLTDGLEDHSGSMAGDERRSSVCMVRIYAIRTRRDRYFRSRPGFWRTIYKRREDIKIGINPVISGAVLHFVRWNPTSCVFILFRKTRLRDVVIYFWMVTIRRSKPVHDRESAK
jgi:hypothetical protein